MNQCSVNTQMHIKQTGEVLQRQTQIFLGLETRNHMEVSNCGASHFSRASTVALCCLNGVSGAVSICGNALVLWTIFKTPSLRITSNFLIASLAAADLIVGLVMNPLYATTVGLNAFQGEYHLLEVENFLWLQTVITTTFSLAAVSGDRYIAIMCPLRYGVIVTSKRCNIAIVSIWVFATSFACLRIFITTPQALDKLWISHAVIAIAAPLGIIAYCYFYILRAGRQYRRQVKRQTPIWRNRRSRVVMKRNARCAWTMAVVIGVFIGLWLPNVIISIIFWATSDSCTRSSIFRAWIWCAFLAFCSSAANPFIYSIRMREFRNAFCRLCPPLRRFQKV